MEKEALLRCARTLASGHQNQVFPEWQGQRCSQETLQPLPPGESQPGLNDPNKQLITVLALERAAAERVITLAGAGASQRAGGSADPQERAVARAQR